MVDRPILMPRRSQKKGTTSTTVLDCNKTRLLDNEGGYPGCVQPVIMPTHRNLLPK
jgi:hypothetical protein